MEVSNLRILGENNAVLYTGKYYIVNNNFFGLVAIAERSEENEDHFMVYVGNSHCIGTHYTNKTIFAKMKAFISKNQSKYVQTFCTFEMCEKNLNKSYLKIDVL